jgi:RNA polymerase sigma-54 factor
LKQEIQETLDSNLMLETEEEGAAREQQTDTGRSGNEGPKDGATEASATGQNDANNEQEINAADGTMPEELPVDSGWDDVYDSSLPPASGSSIPDGVESDYLAQRRSARSLQDYLLWQLNLTPFSDTDRAIAMAIVEGISEDGYLQADLQEILAGLEEEEISLHEVETVLHRIQQFDPPGVAARNPRECLLLQLEQFPPGITPQLEQAITLVRDHFELLAQQDHSQIKRQLKISDDELRKISQLIRSLTPRPGTLVSEMEPQYVVPDVFVSKRNGAWQVDLNPEATPKLRINPEYAKLIRRADNGDDNNYLKSHLQEARWFIKSLVSRNETLLKVATKIVEFQRGYLEHGPEAMRPLVLRDIADALEMHESTISRVTTQKYMHTPRGTLEFKYFFSSHVSTAGGGECSATAIRALIKKLTAAEKPEKPLSDNKIASILAEQGIKVARRTVAKYRESMAIPPSNERKRLV